VKAFTIGTLIEPFQSEADEGELLVPAGPLAEQHLLLVRLHCLVGSVEGTVCCYFTTLFYR
jgi:hypothetical protein